MPRGTVTRYKRITCRTCKKLIRRFDRDKYAGWHVPQEDIMEAIRHHYQKKHPRKFKGWYK